MLTELLNDWRDVALGAFYAVSITAIMFAIGFGKWPQLGRKGKR